jgi:uncharacterized repeat protein (TIGR03803 family)
MKLIPGLDCPNASYRTFVLVALATLLPFAGAQAAGYKVLYSMQPNVGVALLDSLLIDKSGNLYGTAYEGGSGSFCAGNCGTVFELAANGTASALYNFIGYPTDGGYSKSNLIADKAGNFYGTTTSDGANGAGAIFKLASDGTETLLYSFTDGADGESPTSGLVADSSGNLYGTSSVGISPNYGAVFKLAKDGTFTVLHTFADGSDGANPYGGLVIDSSGNLYGTTANAGNFSCSGSGGCGTVFEITASGTFSVLYSFNGGPNDCNGPYDTLLRDKSGDLYGTTYYGGDSMGCIFKYASNGTETKLFSFSNAKKTGEYPIGGLVEDSSGNLYGTTYGGGKKSYGVVFEVSPKGKETVLHEFAGGSDGKYPEASLIVGKKGELYGTTEEGGNGSGCNFGCGTIFEIKE